MDTFELRQGDDDSASAQALAAKLVAVPPRLRARIVRTFGFTLVLKEVPTIRTDPSRVGFGAVRYGDAAFSVIVVPKLSLDVAATFRLIEGANIPSKPQPIEKVILSDLEMASSTNGTSVDWLRHTRDAAALRAIAGVARRGRSAAYGMEHEVLRGRFKGQLDVSQFIRNSLAKGRPQELPVRHLRLGSLSLQDEVLANTARHIGSIRNRPWLATNPVVSSDVSTTRSAFSDVPRRRLTMRDIVAAGRPPYPFGYARGVMAARQYWFNHGAENLESLGEGDVRLWSAVVDLDYIFEMFIGAFLERHVVPALPQEMILSHQAQLHIGLGSESLWSRQDWVLRDASRKTMCVVDAKYKNILDREGDDCLEISSAIRIRTPDIYQLQAYLSHRETRGDAAVGLLMYPTLSTFVVPVEGFRNRLYAVGIPISGSDLKNKWNEAAQQIMIVLK